MLENGCLQSVLSSYFLRQKKSGTHTFFEMVPRGPYLMYPAHLKFFGSKMERFLLSEEINVI